jgi:predicted nucleotidyltransferase
MMGKGIRLRLTMSLTETNDILNDLMGQIVNLVQPRKIILFGSHATGKPTPDSDFDLLIVMPDGTPKRKTAQYLYQNIFGIKIPYDLIVTTETDLIKYRDEPGLIYYSALRNGKEIYAA